MDARDFYDVAFEPKSEGRPARLLKSEWNAEILLTSPHLMYARYLEP
jgi:hypothetical protein